MCVCLCVCIRAVWFAMRDVSGSGLVRTCRIFANVLACFVLMSNFCAELVCSLGANLTTNAVQSIMQGQVADPEKGIQLQEFQQLVYVVYQIKS